MATINFSNVAAGGSINLTLTMIPGTLKHGGGDDVRGGGTIPGAKAGVARNGSCSVLVQSATATWAAITAMQEFLGQGQFVVTSSGIPSSYSAVIKCSLKSDGVQIADIEWMGTMDDPT